MIPVKILTILNLLTPEHCKVGVFRALLRHRFVRLFSIVYITGPHVMSLAVFPGTLPHPCCVHGAVYVHSGLVRLLWVAAKRAKNFGCFLF